MENFFYHYDDNQCDRLYSELSGDMGTERRQMETSRHDERALLVISILGSAFAAGTLALGMHYAGLETYPLLCKHAVPQVGFTCSSPRFFFAACLGIYQFGKHGKKLIDTLGQKNPLPAVSITFQPRASSQAPLSYFRAVASPG